MDCRRTVERESLLDLILRQSVQFPELSDFLSANGMIRSREELIEWLEMEAARGTIVVEDVGVCAAMLLDMTVGALLPRRR
jgi:hypothetical protein